MTVQKDEGGVFEAESYTDSSLVTRGICMIQFNDWHGHIKHSSLHLGLGDEKNGETMAICLANQRVLGLLCMSIKHCHNVILDELQSLLVLVEHTWALVRHNMLQANDDELWVVCWISNTRQKPVFKIDLWVWFDSAHIPWADSQLDIVNYRELF